MKNHSLEAVERNIFSLDWVTIVVLLSLSILAAAKIVYTTRFTDFMMLLVTNKYMLLSGKTHHLAHPFNLLLFVVNILSVSLLLFLLIVHFFDPHVLGFNLYIRIATAYAFWVLVKSTIEKIIANIFSIDDIIDSYLFHKLSYRNLISVLLLPICTLFIFSWQPTQIAFLILGGLVILSNIITLLGFYSKFQIQIFSRWFYFIVYLCALEIAPYIILYKLFTR